MILIQNLIGGLGIGSIYALMGLSFAMIYASMGIVNLAQGELAMLGAYFGIIVYLSLGLPYGVALIAAAVLVALLGLVLERILRPLTRLNVTFLLIATIAIGITLQNIATFVWGNEGIGMPAPFGDAPIVIGGVHILPQTLLIIGTTALIMVALQLFLTRTRWGRAMRAVAQNKEAAGLMGIPLTKMYGLTFAISGAITAMAGVLAAPIFYVTPTMGVSVVVKAFAASLVGGFGNIYGAVIGGLTIGVLEGLSAGYISSSYKNVITLALVILILLFRPWGIFGEKQVKRV
ncbi:MAG TPA: branched-chain amino acid ABC transporter permease [Anaerolineae bacterium]